jgi:hypothetical protein
VLQVQQPGGEGCRSVQASEREMYPQHFLVTFRRNMMMDGLEDQERYLLDMLHAIRESNEKAAKPYLERLLKIRGTRMPKPIVVT